MPVLTYQCAYEHTAAQGRPVSIIKAALAERARACVDMSLARLNLWGVALAVWGLGFRNPGTARSPWTAE